MTNKFTKYDCYRWLILSEENNTTVYNTIENEYLPNIDLVKKAYTYINSFLVDIDIDRSRDDI